MIRYSLPFRVRVLRSVGCLVMPRTTGPVSLRPGWANTDKPRGSGGVGLS